MRGLPGSVRPIVRGFGTTYGAGTTDRISLNNTNSHTAPTLNTWPFTVLQLGSGGGTQGRVFVMEGGGPGIQQSVMNLDTGTTMQLVVGWDANATWTIPRPSLNAWHRHVITYDAGSTANDPAWVVDGVAQSVTETTAPSGTYNAGSKNIDIGNRADAIRVWDGMIAEVGSYNRIWSAREIAEYMAGFSFYSNMSGLLWSMPPGLLGTDLARRVIPDLVTGTRRQMRQPITMIYPSWLRSLLGHEPDDWLAP